MTGQVWRLRAQFMVHVNFKTSRFPFAFLTGNLDGNSQTAAVLDLGGGSVQVTYEPENLVSCALYRD